MLGASSWCRLRLRLCCASCCLLSPSLGQLGPDGCLQVQRIRLQLPQLQPQRLVELEDVVDGVELRPGRRGGRLRGGLPGGSFSCSRRSQDLRVVAGCHGLQRFQCTCHTLCCCVRCGVIRCCARAWCAAAVSVCRAGCDVHRAHNRPRSGPQLAAWLGWRGAATLAGLVPCCHTLSIQPLASCKRCCRACIDHLLIPSG
mmetsp:Transcript_25913/g.65955  ORF Transcript_25913/g.65955 Transcript_25913/m.65955 type:complete len:200 (-) Transcript_25913:41-640(-)